MRANYEQKLDEEILEQLEVLSKEGDLGTEEMKNTIEGISKLMDRSIKIKELKIEEDVQRERIDADYRLRTKEFENEKRSRKIDNRIKIGLFVGSSLLTVGGVIYTTCFEKVDTYSTTAGKGFAKRITSLVNKI